MYLLLQLNFTTQLLKKIYFNQLIDYLWKSNFLIRYWYLNDLIWQEGLLVDFLQKKITDNWIKKFLIFSSYLFNEKLIFESLIKSILNLIILPLHKFFFFDVHNVTALFYFIFILFFFIFYFIFFYFLFFLMF